MQRCYAYLASVTFLWVVAACDAGKTRPADAMTGAAGDAPDAARDDAATDYATSDATDAATDTVAPVDAPANDLTPDATGSLPPGSCASQDDCGGESNASASICGPVSCGGTSGYCRPPMRLCPAFAIPRCGCNDVSYYNDCDQDRARVASKYPGPCRTGAVVACDANNPCPINQVCVDDPRAPCPAGASCPGICLTSSVYECGVPTTTDCLAGFCTAARQTSSCAVGVNGAATCGACVFGSSSCDTTPCPTGQLCVPSRGCTNADAGTCQRFCVIP